MWYNREKHLVSDWHSCYKQYLLCLAVVLWKKVLQKGVKNQSGLLSY